MRTECFKFCSLDGTIDYRPLNYDYLNIENKFIVLVFSCAGMLFDSCLHVYIRALAPFSCVRCPVFVYFVAQIGISLLTFIAIKCVI